MVINMKQAKRKIHINLQDGVITAIKIARRGISIKAIEL